MFLIGLRDQTTLIYLAVHLVALFPLLAGQRVALSVAPQSPVERLEVENEDENFDLI